MDVEFQNMASVPLHPVVPGWTAPNYTFYGGSPLCLYNAGSTTPQESFSYDDACQTSVPLTIPLSPVSLLYTVVVFQGQMPDGICTGNHDCVHLLATALELWKQLPPIDATLAKAVATALTDTQNLDVGLMQFATDANNNWQLLFAPLAMDTTLNPSAWTFYSWILVFDWVQGAREVVSFEGDSGTVVLVSSLAAPLVVTPSGTHNLDGAHAGNQIVFGLLVYGSGVSVFVAALCVAYGMHSHRLVVGRNLFQFNRLTASTWVGRPLTFLRGATAMVLLSTASVQLDVTEGHTAFAFAPRPVIEVLLLAGEASWVAYVVLDIAFVSSDGYDTAVVRLRSATTTLLWVVMVVLELMAPWYYDDCCMFEW
ncbi:hypothetical protein ACHHYP_06426 [Achlya hypogyna]|uniref:Transmembrane protein n=1 Tax=Achlya hypogyna TaxID=1202772 RepID=A0A1V9YTW2_ACHHY|nr:hypothetical protein ACHHYP_06426 [Achlya hypogyna]